MAVNNRANATYGGSLSNVNDPQEDDAPEGDEGLAEPGPAEFFVQGRSETYAKDAAGKVKPTYTTVFGNTAGDRFIVSTSSPISVANVTAMLVPKKS